jgi:hypothetical protein
MFDIGKLTATNFPAPKNGYAELGNRKTPVSLEKFCVIHKTGRGLSRDPQLGDPIDNLRPGHRNHTCVIATCDSWVKEVYLALQNIGTRVLLQQTHSRYLDKNGRVQTVEDGGIFRAVITVGKPSLGEWPDSDQAKNDPAVFVPYIICAEAKEPVRFKEIFAWNNGQFDGSFHPTIRGCTSDAPLAVWEEFVRRYPLV